MTTGWSKAGVVAAVLVLSALACLSVGPPESHGQPPLSRLATGVASPVEQADAVRSTLSGGGSTVALRTRRCPTQTAAGGGRARIPAKVLVQAPAGADARLTAYAASSGEMLPAPQGWECTAAEGADGSESIEAGPLGSVTSRKGVSFAEIRGHGPALRATLIPACEGCIATTICSFFPHAGIVKAYEPLEHCVAEPEGETRIRLSRSTFFYFDPPGVEGTAAGSGGSLPSIGVLSYTRATGVRQLSCTIPNSELDRCTAAVVAFIELGRKA